MSEMEHITTETAVQTYECTREIFDALLNETRELSKKKPDLELTACKVHIINRVLRELMTILQKEPEGKFLAELGQSLPQASDVLFVMVQFEAALDAFSERYDSDDGWMTPELIAELEADGIEAEDKGNKGGAEDEPWEDGEWEDDEDEDDGQN